VVRACNSRVECTIQRHPVAASIRVYISRDTLCIVSQIGDRVVSFSFTCRVEMICMRYRVVSVKRDCALLLLRKDVRCNAFVTVSEVLDGVSTLGTASRVEVVGRRWAKSTIEGYSFGELAALSSGLDG
jgi:hypothetical protein